MSWMVTLGMSSGESLKIPIEEKEESSALMEAIKLRESRWLTVNEDTSVRIDDVILMLRREV